MKFRHPFREIRIDSRLVWVTVSVFVKFEGDPVRASNVTFDEPALKELPFDTKAGGNIFTLEAKLAAPLDKLLHLGRCIAAQRAQSGSQREREIKLHGGRPSSAQRLELPEGTPEQIGRLLMGGSGNSLL